MKQEILNRIKQLGGNTDQVTGRSLAEDLQAITFDTVLYPAPKDTPWQTAEDAEPVYGIDDFINQHEELFKTDKPAFFNKITDHYFRMTREGLGQMFFTGQLFTPFKEGTADYKEWYPDFTDSEMVNLEEIIAITKDPSPDFVHVFESYGFPDNYYICLSDPNPQNPTLFGTDHEVFFREITNEGPLEDFLQKFLTKEELIDIIKRRLES
ncbi:hypothetical protein [Chitinophaga polysaccharea]|uniref:hypothetical protein n=1 Tax=Chitinophaga polysaccharea TaxID=1293035 RepID=UPI00115965EF|nr:hypothetical protein [Chitinophaga polysaccharea]